MTLPDEIYDLIIRKQANALTPDEEKQWTNWLAESVENREEAEQVTELFIRSKRLYALPEPDVEKGYQEFVHYLQLRRRKRILVLFKYAAIFLLPLVLAVIFLQKSVPSDEEHPRIFSENQTISPVTKKVRLQLSSGRSVDLASTQKKTVQEEGVVVNNDSSGLNYRLEETGDRKGTAPGYHTLTVPRGAEYNLTLADGTHIWMNADSELKYPIKFTGENREVYLKGEAYFDVAPDASCPFIVNVGELDIRVLGTSFNVMAYADEARIETTLESGRVEIRQNRKEVELQPGMQAVYEKSSGKLSSRKVNTLLYTSWKDSQMVFEELRLEELFNRLGRWYDVDVFYQNNELKDIRLTGNLSKHEHVSTILELIGSMGKADFKVNDRTIIVKKIQK